MRNKLMLALSLALIGLYAASAQMATSRAVADNHRVYPNAVGDEGFHHIQNETLPVCFDSSSSFNSRGFRCDYSNSYQSIYVGVQKYAEKDKPEIVFLVGENTPGQCFTTQYTNKIINTPCAGQIEQTFYEWEYDGYFFYESVAYPGQCITDSNYSDGNYGVYLSKYPCSGLNTQYWYFATADRP